MGKYKQLQKRYNATITTNRDITKRALFGESIAALAIEHTVSIEKIERIIHTCCFKINPDVYKSGRRIVKANDEMQVKPPLLEWLKENSQIFFKI